MLGSPLLWAQPQGLVAPPEQRMCVPRSGGRTHDRMLNKRAGWLPTVSGCDGGRCGGSAANTRRHRCRAAHLCDGHVWGA